MNPEVRPDLERPARTGDPEAVYGAGKTVAQVVTAARALAAASPRPVVVTRASAEAAEALRDVLVADADGPDGTRTLLVGAPLPTTVGDVVVVCAGTSDLPVAREALAVLAASGIGGELVADVGVAGLHRILAVRDRLARADVLVVVAGMDAALVPVVTGLVACPVVAVPTSVGYGVAAGGISALHAMLASCAAGVTVVNVDNGFGAAIAAARMVRLRFRP